MPTLCDFANGGQKFTMQPRVSKGNLEAPARKASLAYSAPVCMVTKIILAEGTKADILAAASMPCQDRHGNIEQDDIRLQPLRSLNEGLPILHAAITSNSGSSMSRKPSSSSV